MAVNMKAVKRRIKSVNSTKQITKAMELVASSKMRKAKDAAESSRPYFAELKKLLVEITDANDLSENVFAERRTVKTPLYIAVAGDRGLAGGYNSNIFKLVEEAARELNAGDDRSNIKVVAVGKRAVEYFDKHGYDVILKLPQFAETAKTAGCADIADLCADLFRKGEVDEVKLFYTAFVSSMTQTALSQQLLPIAPPEKPKDVISEVEYDPSPSAVFNRVIPKFLMSLIKCAVEESYASEQSARRTAMESATDNAEQMIEHLSLMYNRARQEKITNEINEIVSGANALA
ncbi:ATP synthase gamma chain [Clostridia bacterium]|nr:ATP synthase gamma chain [Clostridia bacterium]